MSSSATMTAEELLRLQLPDKRTELVKGVLVVREPAGYRHGKVASALLRVIGAFVHEHDLGKALAAETGFKLFANPDTVRAPDVAFIARDRLPDPPPAGYARLPRIWWSRFCRQTIAPVRWWQRWRTGYERDVVWSGWSTRVAAIRADGSESLLTEADALDGEDVLPRFSGRLAAIFWVARR
jgi:hypothetical protein